MKVNEGHHIIKSLFNLFSPFFFIYFRQLNWNPEIKLKKKRFK